MYKIEDYYVNNEGMTKIRNIHFPEKKDISGGSFGKFIIESEADDTTLLGKGETDGIFLFESKENPKRAFRIYKDFGDYKYTKHYDDKMIERLQLIQPQVVLTEFPTGIVTIDEYVIGQEVVFYRGLPSLKNVFINGDLKNIPTHYYLEILKIIKELYNNGVVYQDIHSGNFLVDGNKLRLIDFDELFISFNKKDTVDMLNNLRNLIINLNKASGTCFKNDISKANSLEEIEEVVEEEHRILVRKGQE